MSSVSSIRHSAAKAKEKIRINSLKLLHFDSRDIALIQKTIQQVRWFIDGLQLKCELSESDMQVDVHAAHKASDEYHTIKHAMEWDTTFVIPPEAIASNSALFQQCDYDLAKMCRHKQSKLTSNRISKERIISIFGHDGTKIPGVYPIDIQILLDFAV